jgi:hypothetical protein
MQFALLIYEDEAIFGPGKGGPKMDDIVARHIAFTKELGNRRVSGTGLKSTAAATTVRTTQGKQTLHDGPFAETKEQLGGFYLIEAPDLDAAIAIARRVPLAGDGAIEVRPVLGPG